MWQCGNLHRTCPSAEGFLPMNFAPGFDQLTGISGENMGEPWLLLLFRSVPACHKLQSASRSQGVNRSLGDRHEAGCLQTWFRWFRRTGSSIPSSSNSFRSSATSCCRTASSSMCSDSKALRVAVS